MRRLTFARTATLGSAMLLAAALLAVVAARADELSDQHHPDRALQRKLDLLDHGAGAPDADQGSFPRSVRIPGTNTSIRVYGSGAEMLQYSR